MSKQLIFVIGSPYSGRSTWINKNYSKDCVLVDANNYPELYMKSEKKEPKLYEDTIDNSRKWCLEQTKTYMELETPPDKIVLSLIGCRPDKWREFIELAINYSYELVFKFPINKLLFYYTKHNTSMEQYKFIDSKTNTRYPRDKKEIIKKNAKNQSDTLTVDAVESSLLRHIVTETESAYSFYLSNRTDFGLDKIKLLEQINKHYKTTISSDIKKNERKLREAEKEKLKKEYEEEKEALKLAKEYEKLRKKQEQDELDDQDDQNDQQFVHVYQQVY